MLVKNSLLCLTLVFLAPFCAYSQPALDNTLIKAAGRSEIYLLINGTKHYIQQPGWIFKNGYSGASMHVLTPEELTSIPTGDQLAEGSPVPGIVRPLEGMLVVGGDGKIYAVVNGERRWVTDPQWIAKSRYAGQQAIPVTDAELEALPLGGDFTYTPVKRKILIFVFMAAIFSLLFAAARKSSNAFFQKWTGWQARALLTVVFAAAIAFREPFLLSEPRFWAEEGLEWFQYASQHSIIQNLLFVTPLSSYFNLVANIGGVLSSATAATFGLQYAPVATTLFAFLIQISAIALILFGKSRLFDSLWKAVAGCMIVLFASTTTDEIWLNTINSMSFLGLITLVLLFAETQGWPSWLRWAMRGVLVLCGLSSPYSAALLPLFLIWAWRYKDRELKIQSLILILCVVAQAGVVVSTRRHIPPGGRGSQRGTDVRLDASAVNVFCGHMAYPALGYPVRESLFEVTGLKEAAKSASSLPPRLIARSLRVGGWFCFILIAATLWMLRGPTLFSTPNLLIGAFLTLASLTCLAALSSVPTGRYAFMPGLTFLLLLFANIDSPNSRVIGYACMVVLSFGLAVGMVGYRSREFQEGPSWSKEVQMWRANPTHPLRVWPSFFFPDKGIIYAPPSTNRR